MINLPKEPLYKHNQSIVKLYGTESNGYCIKIVTMNTLRTAGLVDVPATYTEKCTANEEKLACNVARARNKIFELSFCNDWDYFFTGTISPEKYDRTDLEKFVKDFTHFVRNQSTKYGDKIRYLIIPELHADGKSWHIHGLLSGVPADSLRQYRVGDSMGKALAEKVVSGDTVYSWLPYAKKFGFCDLEAVKSAEAVSKYVTKYISKDLARSVTEVGAHLYYRSQGLNEAQTIKKGLMLADIKPDFVGQYCSITDLPYTPEVIAYLCENISTDSIT